MHVLNNRRGAAAFNPLHNFSETRTKRKKKKHGPVITPPSKTNANQDRDGNRMAIGTIPRRQVFPIVPMKKCGLINYVGLVRRASSRVEITNFRTCSVSPASLRFANRFIIRGDDGAGFFFLCRNRSTDPLKRGPR